MRSEILYLTDMLEASDAIARFLQDVERHEFLEDEMPQSAVLHKLTVIGEAAAHISDEFKKQHPNIKWRNAVGLRNIVVHEYFGVSWDMIWVTATEDIPTLRQQIAALLPSSDNAE